MNAQAKFPSYSVEGWELNSIKGKSRGLIFL